MDQIFFFSFYYLQWLLEGINYCRLHIEAGWNGGAGIVRVSSKWNDYVAFLKQMWFGRVHVHVRVMDLYWTSAGSCWFSWTHSKRKPQLQLPSLISHHIFPDRCEQGTRRNVTALFLRPLDSTWIQEWTCLCTLCKSYWQPIWCFY